MRRKLFLVVVEEEGVFQLGHDLDMMISKENTQEK